MVEIFDNVRKIYRFQAPCAELADCIEFFSESSAEETKKHIGNESFTVKLFPTWTPSIWFNLGCPYQLVSDTVVHRINPGSDVLILRDNIVERQNLPGDHIFTIKFFPGGLEKILGISQAGLTNRVVDLKTILPLQLINAARNSDSFDQRVELLQGFFITKAAVRKRKDHCVKMVKEVIEAFEQSGLKFKNREIAAKAFTTSKTINRYFHAVVGASPKQYFSALRTRATLTAYLADRKGFLPDEFGYYDMSHFYKDVVKFTGQRLSAQ
jgi:hypothetical protein